MNNILPERFERVAIMIDLLSFMSYRQLKGSFIVSLVWRSLIEFERNWDYAGTDGMRECG
jgi:hypothetical protein